MTMTPAQAHIGTSGYQYDHWRGTVYPADVPKEEWFSYYCRQFSTVEINNTFYHLPTAAIFEKWYEAAPPGFCYALKFSRYGSHMKKLKDPENTIGTFLSAAAPLRETMGPILVQLPPNWTANPKRLDSFLQAAGTGLYAVEFRHRSWFNDDVFAVLEKNHATLCIHDLTENHPDLATTNWVYYRFHGTNYGGNYSHQKLSSLADKIVSHIRAGRDAFVYFNNDLDGHAVANAADLERFVKKRPGLHDRVGALGGCLATSCPSVTAKAMASVQPVKHVLPR